MLWDIIGYLIGLASITLTFFALRYAIRIANEQTRQLNSHDEQLRLIKAISASVDEKFRSTLLTFDAVYQKITELLKEEEGNPDSKAWLMLYWLWFGSDLAFPATPIPDIDGSASRIRELIAVRIEKRLWTRLVLFEPTQERLKEFVRQVMLYRARQENRTDLPVLEDDINGLIDRYRIDLTDVCKRLEGSKRTQAKIQLVGAIPLLIFAIQGGKQTGLLYLGETEALKRGAQTGGFISQDITAVQMFINHVESFFPGEDHALSAGQPQELPPAPETN
jgi:hypothetical protein